MGKKFKPFTGGYSGFNDLSADRLKNVSIPERIKCMVCKRSKKPDHFSGKQLSDLRFRIYRCGQGAIPPEGAIKCVNCTGKQRTEMKCYRCNRVLELDKFSLAQRRKKDEPVCMLCQENVDWTEPDERDYTTGHDETTVSDDYESDYSDESSQVYEITESGEYATSSAATESGSVFSSSDTDGGGVDIHPKGGLSSSTPGRSNSKKASSVQSSSQPTTKPSLTRHNLQKLSTLTITDRSSGTASTSHSEQPDFTANAHAWNSFSDDRSVITSSTATSGVWVQQKPGMKGSHAASSNGDVEDDNVWTGHGTRGAGRTYNAYDPQGRVHERQQSIPSVSTPRIKPAKEARPVRDKGEKFPRVRPQPAVRPKRLDVGEEKAFNIPGMDYDDSDSENEWP